MNPDENETIDTANVTMAELTEDESLPEVNQAAVDAIRKEQEDAEKLAQAEANNPAPHGLRADGKPAKKRGRKPKTATAQNYSPLNMAPQNAEQPRQSLAAAITTSSILENMQVTLISHDFKYTEEERAFNIHAWEKTYDHYGGVKIHPAVELAMSHMSIIATRATASSDTKTKFALLSAWLKSKFKRKKKEDARAGSREDVIGQDNVRGKEG